MTRLLDEVVDRVATVTIDRPAGVVAVLVWHPARRPGS